MKRLDRAMFAIFLLALLADVARAHASVPAGDDAGFILSAASQLQAGSADGAMVALRRPDGSAPMAAFDRLALQFCGWSKQLSGGSGAAAVAASAVRSDASRAVLPSSKSAFPSRAVFEHTGSPAP
jgi:hypothetical protein